MRFKADSAAVLLEICKVMILFGKGTWKEYYSTTTTTKKAPCIVSTKSLEIAQAHFIRKTFTSWLQLLSVHGAENQSSTPAKPLKPTGAANHMDLIDWLNLQPHSELTWRKPHTLLKLSEQA